jgi:hypothetical protein
MTWREGGWLASVGDGACQPDRHPLQPIHPALQAIDHVIRPASPTAIGAKLHVSCQVAQHGLKATALRLYLTMLAPCGLKSIVVGPSAVKASKVPLLYRSVSLHCRTLAGSVAGYQMTRSR